MQHAWESREIREKFLSQILKGIDQGRDRWRALFEHGNEHSDFINCGNGRLNDCHLPKGCCMELELEKNSIHIQVPILRNPKRYHAHGECY
jgi:hypothetical protein